tara:strand:- start:75143 stop:76723 length:1581 start_codon:yes stop_codon:yes gene_type:complete
MSELVNITKLDETWMKVLCSEVYQELDIQDRFSFKAGNEFDPRVKKGHWDGIKKLYNRRTKRMHVGLLLPLLELLNKKGWEYNVDPDLLPSGEQLDDEDVNEFFNFLDIHDEGEPLTPYDYQKDAFKYMMNMDRTTSLLATSSGKSLIIYAVARAYQLMDEFQGKHIVICVPSVALVEQIYSDFENYSNKPNRDWSVSKHVQKVSAKYPKELNCQIIVTTWQSMSNMPLWVYEDIKAVLVDETHSASAKELGRILESCNKAPIKHGVTGTLNGMECDEMQIHALLGPIKRFTTAKQIIDMGNASKIKIYMSILNYPLHLRKKFWEARKEFAAKDKAIGGGAKTWNYEVDFINSLKERTDFVFSMIDFFEGNKIVLFDRVEGYGKEMYEQYKESHPNKPVFLIVGGVKGDEREEIRKSMENYDDAVIFASFGTMKQGVSIKKLHWAFFVSSGKAKIKVLQTVGRLMRNHKTKESGNIIDIVDDLSLDGQKNSCYKHAIKRIEYYTDEEHEVNFDKYELPDTTSVDLF